MSRIVFLSSVFIVFLLGSCQPAEKPPEIIWDDWGVPHIYAQNEYDLYYAFGWAQMNNHGDLILELYGNARGRGAEYWGQEKVQSDRLIHTLGFPAQAEKNWSEFSEQEKTILSAFADGMNAYAEAFPEQLAEAKKVVLPIQPTDVILHSLFVVYTRFVGGGELRTAGRWSEMGSNTYAVGPSRSASGNAMLVQNPHLPWQGEFLFFEGHFNLSDLNLYGAGLVGLPNLAIAFNENLGWSHTNNTIDNADLYELTLRDEGYVLDGEVVKFERDTATLKVAGEEEEREIEILRSVHGPVIGQKGGKALALRMPGFDRPSALLQWWQMGQAENFEEFETALKREQMPFWNVMYADREGNIFYLFNGHVPVRNTGDWDFWSNVVAGDRSELIWDSIHPYEDLPKVKNPPTGWLQNANDPPWTSTLPMELDPDDFPPYMAPRGMSFRPQRSARMLAEDESVTFEELVEYKHDTRMELADRILDDLAAGVDAHGSEVSRKAMAVLNEWDREADADSRGAFLFYEWARRVNPYNAALYAETWDSSEPLSTPDGLADPQRAVNILEKTAIELEAQLGSLDIPWGDAYRLRYGDMDLPANGADGSVGVFRVAWPGGMDEGKMYVGGGDSWFSVIEFGDKVRAKVLLSYGNATQEDSPHRGDQLKLFSEKKMRDARFYRDDVERHINSREILDTKK